MSVNQSQPAPAPELTPEQLQEKMAEAYQAAVHQINHDVYMPTFFGTLKQAGVVPANDAEVRDLLKLAAQLRQAQEQETAKTASAQSRFATLVGELSDNGLLNEDRLYSAKVAAAQHLHTNPALHTAVANLVRIESAMAG